MALIHPLPEWTRRAPVPGRACRSPARCASSGSSGRRRRSAASSTRSWPPSSPSPTPSSSSSSSSASVRRPREGRARTAARPFLVGCAQLHPEETEMDRKGGLYSIHRLQSESAPRERPTANPHRARPGFEAFPIAPEARNRARRFRPAALPGRLTRMTRGSGCGRLCSTAVLLHPEEIEMDRKGGLCSTAPSSAYSQAGRLCSAVNLV